MEGTSEAFVLLEQNQRKFLNDKQILYALISRRLILMYSDITLLGSYQFNTDRKL